MILGQQLRQPLMEWRTVPIHPVVDSILDSRMPVSLRQRIVITNDITHRMTVLETSELTFTVPHTQNQVTSSLCCLHRVDTLVQSSVPLEHVPQNESKRVAQSTLLPECLVRV